VKECNVSNILYYSWGWNKRKVNGGAGLARFFGYYSNILGFWDFERDKTITRKQPKTTTYNNAFVCLVKNKKNFRLAYIYILENNRIIGEFPCLSP
jgi:hypothetical protein